jgi:hypothetical protein
LVEQPIRNALSLAYVVVEYGGLRVVLGGPEHRLYSNLTSRFQIGRSLLFLRQSSILLGLSSDFLEPGQLAGPARMLPKTEEANAAMCSVYDDVELLDWLRWSHENGPSFLRTIVEAVFTADLKNYNLLRPALLKLKETNPRTGWSTII